MELLAFSLQWDGLWNNLAVNPHIWLWKSGQKLTPSVEAATPSCSQRNLLSPWCAFHLTLGQRLFTPHLTLTFGWPPVAYSRRDALTLQTTLPNPPPTLLIPSDNTSLTAYSLLWTHHVNLLREGRKHTSNYSTSVALPTHNAPVSFWLCVIGPIRWKTLLVYLGLSDSN